ncbi:MAG TPA: SAM-dependent methyltransferase [Xanthobacteraceae bacterium]|jgi:SAM-dependent MidA family methyltransferase
MTPLEKLIRAIIESEGPISVSRYMALCLGHPVHGYYMTREPLGATGDFVTAPEVSQIFGELLGLWCAEVWRMMGTPSPVCLVELGPGRGTLIADLLRAARVAPEFHAALELHLVETSPPLAARQRAALASAGSSAQWHRSVDTLPERPSITIANEFVDALPVDQFVRSDDGWHERKVGIRNDRLAFALDPAPLRAIDAMVPQPLRAHRGVVFERRDLTPIIGLAARIPARGGVALVIDYGHTRSAFGDTLQAVRAHRVADPLQSPGEADLTAHVDFEQLAAAAMKAGVDTVGPITQGKFLRALGIELRAERLKHGKDTSTVRMIDEAVARLAGRAPGMGELFKVLALAHPALPILPGFDS